MTQIFQLIVAAAALGTTYALIGLGYNLAFSTLRAINFAQGQLYMVGSMVFVSAYTRGWPLWICAICGVLAAGAVSVAIERIAISPALRGGFGHSRIQASLIASTAAGIAIEGAAQLIWGTQERFSPALVHPGAYFVGGVVIGTIQLQVIGGGILAAVALWALLRHTSLGLAIRAAEAEPTATALQGINVRIVVSSSFMLAGMLGGLAGILITPLSSAVTTTGLQLSIIGLLASLLGGLQNTWMVVPAGFLIALLEEFLGNYVSTEYGFYYAIFCTLGLLLMMPFFAKAREVAAAQRLRRTPEEAAS